MTDHTPDTPGVIAPPPFIYLCTLTIGLLLSVVFPVDFLPIGLRLVLGVPLIGLGILGMSSAFNAIRRAGTSVDPYEPTTRIVTDGPYRLTRNPIYLSFAIIYLGIALLLGAAWALLLLPIALVIIDRGVIVREEKYLERKFWEQYLRYKAQVRRWI